MKLDMGPDKRRIEHAGSEDRAMLRSNPSAAADAGMGAWRWSSRWSWGLATPSPKRGCHPGRKAINLSRLPSNTPSGVPYGKISRGVGANRPVRLRGEQCAAGVHRCPIHDGPPCNKKSAEPLSERYWGRRRCWAAGRLRRRSRARGLLFYRLLQNAVQVDPVPYRQLVGGSSRSDHNM